MALRLASSQSSSARPIHGGSVSNRKFRALEPFIKVKQQLQANYPNFVYGLDNYLLVSEDGRFLDIVYHAWGDGFEELLRILCQPDIAQRIRTLKFSALTTLGANGTRDWDFTDLVESDVIFPNLLSLAIETYDFIGSSRPIISSRIGQFKYAEKGTLAKWLTKAPNLKFLSSPSALDEAFFKRLQH